MKNHKLKDILFVISVEDLQFEARGRIGRELSEDEVMIAKKGLEYGLNTSIDIIYKTIFSELLK